MAVTRYFGQPLPIVVTFPSNPLTVYNKTYDDITEVAMNFKKNLETDLDDAYLQKTTVDGVTYDTLTHTFTMALDPADYANLEANETYHVTLNIRVSGISEYLEMDIPDRLVHVTPDTNRA